MCPLLAILYDSPRKTDAEPEILKRTIERIMFYYMTKRVNGYDYQREVGRRDDQVLFWYSLELLKNRVKKCNEVLPDCVKEHVGRFVCCECKRCVRTRQVMDDETVRFQRFVVYGKW